MPSNTRGRHNERSSKEQEEEEGVLGAAQPEVAENKLHGRQGELRQEWSQQPRVAFKLQHRVSTPPPRASTFPSVKWRQAQRLGIIKRT